MAESRRIEQAACRMPHERAGRPAEASGGVAGARPFGFPPVAALDKTLARNL
jgi:hypothetical protein